ncbi:MAG: F0F1 ATP synthase subunit B' [Alphaproteobacteria bacterium]
MAEESAHSATTEAPKEGGFPPFDTSTFPSQFFWLAITFAFLFTVLWRVAGPRINAAITNRRGAINDAIAEASKARADAEAAQAGYEATLAGARARGIALAEETRQKLNAEIAKAKAEADAKAAEAMHAAEARIAQTRETAKGHVKTAARDAAIAIVERLTGDKVSAEDATQALGMSQGN